MIALNEFEHQEMLQNLEMIVRSDRVFERAYESTSPEVIEWTDFFYKRAKIEDIFKEIWDQLKSKDKLKAEVVGTFWHHFSSLAPQVMSMAAYKVSNNSMRHYIVQVIFEELGSRNHRMIHPDLFLDCLTEIGVKDNRRDELVRKYLSLASFEYLLNIMNDAKSDSKILGILLGLEIDAEENISTILDALSYDTSSDEIANKSSFFRIHKIVEIEHIRLDVSNFLRFCPNEKDKNDFMLGFDEAVSFWKMYWNGISSVIDREKMS